MEITFAGVSFTKWWTLNSKQPNSADMPDPMTGSGWQPFEAILLGKSMATWLASLHSLSNSSTTTRTPLAISLDYRSYSPAWRRDIFMFGRRIKDYYYCYYYYYLLGWGGRGGSRIGPCNSPPVGGFVRPDMMTINPLEAIGLSSSKNTSNSQSLNATQLQ